MTTEQEELAQTMSGKAWEEFCESLKSAGQAILRPTSPDNPLDRAEGFRYLSRLVRYWLEAYMEGGDPLWPVLKPATHNVTVGITNPDTHYLAANISGQHNYRVWGTRGSVAYISFCVFSGSYMGGGRTGGRQGALDGHELQVNADGSFQIVLSSKPQPGNWLPMTPASSRFIVRQTYLDRATEQLAHVQIERLGASTRRGPPPITPERVARALARTARAVAGTARQFAHWTEVFAGYPNEFKRIDDILGAETSSTAGADPNIKFWGAYFHVEPDEALVVELRPPPCEWWGLQLCNWWQESINHGTPWSHINKHTARYERNGSVRVVIAHRDPGLPNWVDTGGHHHGIIGVRWVRSEGDPQPVTRKVKLTSLR